MQQESDGKKRTKMPFLFGCCGGGCLAIDVGVVVSVHPLGAVGPQGGTRRMQGRPRRPANIGAVVKYRGDTTR